MTNLFSLEGKVALVTGAAYGIGFAMAEALAKAGAEIAFNCRGQEHMDKALADYEAKGIKAHGYICDVTNEADVQKMVADIRKELGHIDILVNNAGIIKRIPMHEMTRSDFQRVIDVDLVGPYICSAAVVPEMKHDSIAALDPIKLGTFHGAETTSYVRKVWRRYEHYKHICP